MAPVCRYQMGSCEVPPFRTGFVQCLMACDTRGAMMTAAPSPDCTAFSLVRAWLG